MASHRERLVAAMRTSALQAWPFAGAIAWREGPAPQPWHVVEDWCYLGSVAQLDAAAGLVTGTGVANPVRFDADTYQILLPHLATLLADAVPIAATRPFVLTALPPLLPAPAAQAPTRGAKRKTQTASVLQQPLYESNMIDEMAALLGITHILHQKAAMCSYGEQQRIAIIRALMQPFNWLIMDEPFSHLDKHNINKAAALIDAECKKRNAGFLLTDLEDDENFNYMQLLNL